MNIGLDIGYSSTKAVAGERYAYFPSVVGTTERARFSLNGNDGTIVLEKPDHVQIGEGAVMQSRFLHRREDRGWVTSAEWLNLARAAWSEITAAISVEMTVVTGLPVSFFEGDKVLVRDRLRVEHKFQREGRHIQTVKVVRCQVIPQPFGALLAVCLDHNGKVIDNTIAGGTCGLIDIGGKTTNLLSVYKLREIGAATESISVGAWDVVRNVRTWMHNNCPGLELRDHQIVQAVIDRQVRYDGEPVDISGIVDDTLSPLANNVVACASQLWNGGHGLDTILIAGGGALLLGRYIQRELSRAHVVDNPVYANALGYWKFAQRLDK